MSKRPLTQVALFFVFGIVLVGTDTVQWQVICCTILCLAVVCGALAWHEKRCCRSALWLWLLPIWTVLGVLCMWKAAGKGQTAIVADKETVCICGTIYDIQNSKERMSLYLNNVYLMEQGDISSGGRAARSKTSRACIVYYDGNEAFSIGNTITLSGKISIFQKARNKGQFDAASYYRAQKIDFSIFPIEILDNDHKTDVWKQTLYNWKQSLHACLDKLAGQHASVLQAMLLGEKAQMDSEIKELYQRNGISHVLVISGLHFSMIGMSLYQLLRRFGSSFWAAGSVSVILLFLYGSMTGFGTSAVRAFIMFAISIGAQVTGRDYDMASALGLAVLFLAAANPFVLYQAGFLLSVGAVLGILLVVPAVELLLPGKNKLLQGLVSGIGIQLATFPLLLYFFYECAPYSILLNCLILPLLPVVILGAIGALLIGMVFPAAGGVLVQPSLWVLELYQWLCQRVERLPGSLLVTGQPERWRIVIYYGVLTGVLTGIYMWRKQSGCVENKKKNSFPIRLLLVLEEWGQLLQERRPAFMGVVKRVAGVLGVITGIFLVYGILVWHPETGMELTMLDVGQGQAIYVRSGSMNMLFDGGSTDVSKPGKYRIAPFLKASGVKQLDLVVVSHLDADHYNGIEELMEDELIEIQSIWFSELAITDESYEKLTRLAKKRGVEVRTVSFGDTFWMEEMQGRVLHPSPDYKTSDKNDTSMVVELVYHDFKMLLTGDVEEGGEASMLEAGVLEDVDVLQVAHHGSASSSTEAFLEELSPKVVLISCGKDNRYGHPAAETLERLRRLGCEIHLTMDEGSISMKVR